MKIEEKKILRKQELIQKLNMHKLEYKNHGDCYSYVHRGFPPIDTIIKNELNRKITILQRKKKLCDILESYNLEFSNDNDIHNNFIKGLDVSIDQAIEEAKIEQFYINHTNYLEYRKEYSSDLARDKALNDYLKNNDIINHDIAKKIIEKTFTLEL